MRKMQTVWWCIRISLSNGPILQFVNETNVKKLWKTIHDAGPTEDRAIDAGEELRNIKMMDNETASDYISHAKGLSVKCASAGLNISEQLVYNVVRGLYNKYSQVREILKTREKKLDEILEIIREKKREKQKKNGSETMTGKYICS